MGYAVAEAAARRGAKVVLVSGPTSLDAPGGVERISVRTAEEMHRAVTGRFAECSIAILAAAVAGLPPGKKKAPKKKPNKTILTAHLEPTEENLPASPQGKGGPLVGGVAPPTRGR